METITNEKVEYRVREVKRWIVTRFESSDHIHEDGRRSYSGGSASLGEFENEMGAYNVAYTLCKEEHGRLGWPVGDGRIKYPEHPDAIRDDAKASE